MDESTLNSLQASVRAGTFSPAAIPDFFRFLARLGNEDEEMQEEVEGWSGVIDFHLSGLGEFWLAVQDGVFSVGQGGAPAASLTLSLSGEDAARIFTGALDAEEALARGLLRLEGDITAAIRLQTLLEIAMEHLLED